MKKKLNRKITQEMKSLRNKQKLKGVFSESELKSLPNPVNRFFHKSGWIGKSQMDYMKAQFYDVDFMMTQDKKIKIDYTQYNFVETPVRFAYIKSSVFGIPFEGLDSYHNGVGSMKGKLAKIIPLFHQTGESLNQSCLATILAECFLVPSVALQKYITWEAMDDIHAKASISWNGTSAKGLFTFDMEGLPISFLTEDRTAVDVNGVERKVNWSAYYEDYQMDRGVLKPTVLYSAWHYPQGDQIYFNENKSNVTIDYF